jgi:peptidoglycan hydrolase-like protein with peptidoglycan-binding domain
MRTGAIGVLALGLLTAACGTSTEQRTATGGLLGAGIGALAGGPIGAAIGAGAGLAAGVAMPEDATTLANNALGREKSAARTALNSEGSPVANLSGRSESTGASVAAARAREGAPVGVVKEAQTQLKGMGLYNGRIDGIVGPETRAGLRDYQQREGLSQTARLDRATVQHMNLAETVNSPGQVGSGSSSPQDTPQAPETPPQAPQNPPQQ